MAIFSRIPAALTSKLLLGAAALSMGLAPASAADLPVPAPVSAAPVDAGWDSASEDAQRHRYRRYRRHRGVDAGDVVAGVVIIGAIAAIAGAASRNNDRDRRYRDRRYRDRDYRQDYRRDNARYSDNRGLDNAVDICMRRIERDARVESVDNVSRNGEGWNVSGSLYNGEGFTCRIGNDGRVSDIDFGRGGISATQDRQWSDDRYSQAWNDTDRAVPAPVQTARAPASQGQPAYPGGPVEGDDRPVWTGGQ